MAATPAIHLGQHTHGKKKSELIVELRDTLGLPWSKIAEIVYGRSDDKTKLKVYSLYFHYKKRAKNHTEQEQGGIRRGDILDGTEPELVPERNWAERATPGLTVGTMPAKLVRSGDERYLEEAVQILRFFYDLVIAQFDYDRSVLAYAEHVLRQNSDLLRGERVHYKRSYVKLTPRVAAVIYASFFAATYNLNTRARDALSTLFYRLVDFLSMTREVRNTKDARKRLQEELERVMPRFTRYLVPRD